MLLSIGHELRGAIFVWLRYNKLTIMTNEPDPHRMWCDLKAYIDKKPPDTCSAATQDEYFVGIQSSFVQLITRFPLFTVEHKIELEMWNVLYKTQINSLQSLVSFQISFIILCK